VGEEDHETIDEHANYSPPPPLLLLLLLLLPLPPPPLLLLQPSDDRRLVIKAIDKQRVKNINGLQRISNEIEALRILRHPNILTLYSVLHGRKGKEKREEKRGRKEGGEGGRRRRRRRREECAFVTNGHHSCVSTRNGSSYT